MPLADEQEEEGEDTDVSLITGALRSHNLLMGEPAESSYGSAVVLRNQTLTVASTNSAGEGHSGILAVFTEHIFIVYISRVTIFKMMHE